MYSLTAYIEYLVMTQRTASVPGVGTWRALWTEAGVGAWGNAPRCEVHFTTEGEDAGAARLVDICMDAEGLTCAEARSRVEAETGRLVGTLHRVGRVAIGSLGELVLTEGHATAFRPAGSDAAASTSPFHFGLAPLTMRPWAELSVAGPAVVGHPAVPEAADARPEAVAGPAATAPRRSEAPTLGLRPEATAYHIAIPRLWLRRAAAVALAVGALLSASTSRVDEADHHRDYASLIDPAVIMGTAPVGILLGSTAPADVEAIDLTTPMAEVEADGVNVSSPADAPEPVASQPMAAAGEARGAVGTTDPVGQPSASPTAQADAPGHLTAPMAAPASPAGSPAMAEATPGPSAGRATDPLSPPSATPPSASASASTTDDDAYYIIIASCATRAGAETTVARYERRGAVGVGIVEGSGRWRIYLSRHASHAEAVGRLRELREADAYPGAWLLRASEVGAPLSFLIIDLYNRGPLSLELPHLNRTAEREEG